MVEYVQFKGSSSDIVAIQDWVNGETEKPFDKRMSTCDMRNFDLFIDGVDGLFKSIKVRPGNYVIKDDNGKFSVSKEKPHV